MKKIIIALLTVSVVLGLFAVTASAGKTDFSVTITGNEAVKIGDEVTYTVEIAGTSSEKLFGFEIALSYDTDMFEYISGSGTDTDWDDKDEGLPIEEKSGVIYLDPVCTKTWTDAVAVTRGGKFLVYKIKLKVKNTVKTSSDIAVTSASGEDAQQTSFDGNWSDFTVKIVTKLATPQNPVWDGATAKWDAVANADSYVVQLYKDGEKYETEDNLTSTAASLDLASTMEDGGKYTFTVTAVSNKPEFDQSDESAKSEEHTVKGDLTTPKISLESDFSNGGLKYQITDKNPNNTCKYKVEIFENGVSEAAIAPIITTSKSGNVELSKLSLGKKYCATVTAVANDTEIYNDSDPSAKTAAVEAVDAVKRVVISTQPKRVYTAGEKLDLSDLVVKVTYETSGEKDIKYSDFGSVTGLSITEESGKVLAVEDNNMNILIVYGTVNTSFTVTVNSNDCKHTKTHTEHKDATCGAEGYDRTVCDDCSAVVTQTIINPTGEHLFDAWVVEFSPTINQNGQRKRTCAVCGHVETEVIPAAGTTEADTDPDDTEDLPGDNTEDLGDDTGEEFEDPGDTSDVSKIFLIVVIVIFALILLFIIGGIWLDSRRSKARKAMAARRNMRK